MTRSRWNDYDWQLLHDGPPEPALHVALDQVLTEEVAAGRRAPILRFWEWASPCVVIGRFQSLANEVDPAGARRYGINVVRRISGGGAMFMEAGNCITYSIHAPESLVEGMSFQESYAFFDQWVIDALGDRKSVVEGKSGGCVGRGGMVKREGGRDRQGVGGLRDEIV